MCAVGAGYITCPQNKPGGRSPTTTMIWGSLVLRYSVGIPYQKQNMHSRGKGEAIGAQAWPDARWFLAGMYILSLMLLLIPCSISEIDPKVVRRVLLGPMSLL